jgi:RNase H-like protein
MIRTNWVAIGRSCLIDEIKARSSVDLVSYTLIQFNDREVAWFGAADTTKVAGTGSPSLPLTLLMPSSIFAVRERSVITLSSDSEYLIREIEHLASRWAGQGWRNRKRLPIKDSVLCQKSLEMKKHHFIRLQWIRGHNSYTVQVEADKFAYREAATLVCIPRSSLVCSET